MKTIFNSILLPVTLFSQFLLTSCSTSKEPLPQPAIRNTGLRTDVTQHDTYSADVYDYYPGTTMTATGTSVQYPWSGFNFNGYPNWSIIEDAGGSNNVSQLDVTSGKLYSRVTEIGAERGYVDDPVFRMVAETPLSESQKVSWSDLNVKARFYPKTWQQSNEEWQGLHLFARYQTEYDLYVASLRCDGSIYIKRKLNGRYIKIASHRAVDGSGNDLAKGTDGKLLLNKWYNMEFTIKDTTASFYINGVRQFNLTRYGRGNVDLTKPYDPAEPENPLRIIPGGTAGVRLDYVSTYLDDWSVE